MAFYDGLLNRKEKGRIRRQKQKERMQKEEERTQKKRRSAYLIANKERKDRTDGERAECLLQGLQSDVESFYEQVIMRAGLKTELDATSVRSRFFADAEDYKPGADAGKDAADEFLRETGMSPRNFLSRGHLKGMAYRLRKLGEYVEIISDSSSLKSEYRNLIKNLQKIGIYRELAKLDDKL